MDAQVVGRRSNIEIIGDILRLGKTGKTNIMYGCDLSYYQLQKYLRFLLEHGFIEMDGKSARRSYRPTSNGEQLLNHIEEVRFLLGLSDRDADIGLDQESIGAEKGVKDDVEAKGLPKM